MTTSNFDVEHLVQLVLDRVSKNGEQIPQTNQPFCHHHVTVTDSVISLQTVASWKAAVKRLQIPARSLITPAAWDEIKRRGIEIVPKQTMDANSSSKPQIRLGVWKARYSLEGLTKNLQRVGYDVVSEPNTMDLERFASGLHPVNHSGQQLGVLMTGKPAVACCQLNRHDHIRAAVAFDWTSSCAAAQELQPNVALFDVSNPTPTFVVNVVRRLLTQHTGGQKQDADR